MNQFAYNKRRPVDNSIIPTVIFALLVINGLVFALEQFQYRLLAANFALWPVGTPGLGVESHPWQLITYGFLHDNSGINHLLFNMFGLWMFGRDIEREWGASRFLTYYLVCVVGAGIVQLLFAGVQGSDNPTIGASGGVFGVLLAFGMLYPNRMVLLLIPPIPMKAKYLVAIFGVLELFYGVTGSNPGVANFAHLGGMLFGFGLIQYWRKN